jgi:hypothetical protein
VISNKAYLLAGEVDAHSTLAEQASIKLILVTGHTRDDNITQRRNILKCSTLHIDNLVSAVLQTLATGELLDTGNINTVHASAIIGQQRGQWTANNLRAVHDADSVTEQTVAVGKDSVVDVEVLEDLDVGQRGARQDALLALGLRVEEADVLIHVEDVTVAKTLDILADIDDLLQVLVLTVVEDRVVDDDAVDVRVGVGGDDGLFDIAVGDFAEGVLEASVQEFI